MSYLPARRARGFRPPRRRGRELGLAGLSEWMNLRPQLPPMPEEGSAGEDVALLRRIARAQDRFVENENRTRWVQIGAIVAIPVFQSLWKWIARRGKDVTG